MVATTSCMPASASMVPSCVRSAAVRWRVMLGALHDQAVIAQALDDVAEIARLARDPAAEADRLLVHKVILAPLAPGLRLGDDERDRARVLNGHVGPDRGPRGDRAAVAGLAFRLAGGGGHGGRSFQAGPG